MSLASSTAEILAARTQMALTLGFHIVLAAIGIGLPALTLLAEWRGHRTGDPVYRELARRWAKATGVLFAVGAVSGTVLSFEMGTLWPHFMAKFGQVFGAAFAMEGIAFFIEAIFMGIYLYGWDRLSSRAHLLTGIPIVVGGIASAFFVVTVNSWMNQPRGFRIDAHGNVTDVRPLAAMFNPATPPEAVHLILASFMVCGFTVASVYAVALLRGKRDAYHRRAFAIPFTFAAVTAPIQVIVGDWATRFVADNQPVKFAAMEGIERTRDGVPFRFGFLEIPNMLSVMLKFDPNARLRGLDSWPENLEPPKNVPHYAFDIMVAIGTGLVLLGAWALLSWWRRRDLPRSRWFLRAAALAGIGAVIAMEAGWTTTEVGRQPWIVYGVMRVDQAVNPGSGLTAGLYIVIAVYALLAAVTITVLRRIARAPGTAVGVATGGTTDPDPGTGTKTAPGPGTGTETADSADGHEGALR
ncbi:cytochrome ubiquinol oxidase subunit I [Actinoallomurus purpureus]|uniref:cytochrome ubiquinol oxidase subunit I n=1 Tax=Actinoallomurus purpureus TaxID=478114 RepID=UPI0020929BE3|nr:cytochrome ubiquinol oxidase subunit I [Actinoallomurus purpureus]MCO6010841.1 cytochrome ubiquinol oxidase subunit I [Actinoallomurus purpureus]